MIWILFALLLLAAYTWGCWTGLRRGHKLGQEDALRQVSSW